MSNKERLQKVIAASGYTSRRKAETLILENKVKVDGKVVNELGTRVSPNAIIHVNGVLISKEEKVYYVINKPKNVLSSVSDDRNRPVIVDYIAEERRVYPVGRLDYDTSGLLLLTNDGSFAHLLTHPKYGVEKTYLAKVEGVVYPKDLKSLSQGMVIDGIHYAPAQYKIKSTDRKQKTSLVYLTVHEGKYHQIKYMLQAVGYPVQKLKRETFGGLTLAGLQPGKYRPLTRQEVHELKQQAKK